eukprot:gene9299-biopygen6107
MDVDDGELRVDPSDGQRYRLADFIACYGAELFI